MKHSIKHSIISIRKLLLRTFLSFSIPALALLMLYTVLLIQRQTDTEIEAYQNNLTVYVNSLDRVFEHTESQLNSVVYSNSSFQLFSYSTSISAQYRYARQLMAQFSMLQQQEDQLAGILLYSADPFFYYPIWNIQYSYKDTRDILSYLDSTSATQRDERQWVPLELSDRIVYIRLNSNNEKIAAAIIDPSLGIDPYHPNNDITYFFSTGDGDTLYPLSALDSWDQVWTESTVQKGTWQEKPYYLIKQKLTSEDIYLCCMAPKKNLLGILTATEKVIIVLMIVLIFSVPFLWFFLYRQLLNPLSVLTRRMQQIADGKEIPQVSEDQPIEELRAFSKTLNYLLNNIQNLKLDAYDQKINLMQAQLQYLHLQIRPHFYINCLKNIYSLAEEKDYEQIQKVTLSLSDYFRYIFRDNRKLIPLREELHSVKTYITLQQLNCTQKITLTMDVDAKAAEIPILPLSILTFVENSIKHSQNTSELNISIKVSLIHAASGMQFLNTVISSNNGGFPPEILDHLNNIPEYKSLYDDYHVGISNVYYRMELTYHQKGTLEFYNVDHNSYVEITIPILDSEESS